MSGMVAGRTTVLISALALTVGVVSAQAQQFPYREPGPYRTAFVESVTKACTRANLEHPSNAGVPKETLLWFCDCKAITLATFITAQDVKDAAEGGMHATARTDALEQKAEAGCLNVLTGSPPLLAAGSFEDASSAYRRGDYAIALREFRLLADQGHAVAQYDLGLMYFNGQGVQRDFTEAVKWFRLAADKGHAGAKSNLGAMYLSGQGVPQNVAEAVRLYRLAAGQGYAIAQHNLGAMYLSGQGVAQDYVEAARWFRLAAEQGYASAQFGLGVLYEDGQGVAQDYVRAHMWYNLASALYPATDTELRNEVVKYRDALSVKMTPAQIAEAQKLAREWKPTAQPPR
jgi:uncharacterized protein